MPVYLPPISRRRFLTSAAAAAAALALGPGCTTPKRNPDENTVALVSDIHIDADADLIDRHANMTNNLNAVVADVLSRPQRPGTMFINGDLAHNIGSTGDYGAVVEILRPIREAGMPIWMGMGNHDNRENFWDVLPNSKDVPPDLPGRQTAIVPTPYANWFMLDSLIQTRTTPGRLGTEQLAWLGSALDANASKPAIILVHHEPDAIIFGKTIGLEDADELMAVLRPRRQVKAYFFGHTHRWEVRPDDSGIHLINLPPTAYLFEEGKPNGWVQASIQENGMRLELRCIDQKRKDHGEVKNLSWRNA